MDPTGAGWPGRAALHLHPVHQLLPAAPSGNGVYTGLLLEKSKRKGNPPAVLSTVASAASLSSRESCSSNPRPRSCHLPVFGGTPAPRPLHGPSNRHPHRRERCLLSFKGSAGISGVRRLHCSIAGRPSQISGPVNGSLAISLFIT